MPDTMIHLLQRSRELLLSLAAPDSRGPSVPDLHDEAAAIALAREIHDHLKGHEL